MSVVVWTSLKDVLPAEHSQLPLLNEMRSAWSELNYFFGVSLFSVLKCSLMYAINVLWMNTPLLEPEGCGSPLSLSKSISQKTSSKTNIRHQL